MDGSINLKGEKKTKENKKKIMFSIEKKNKKKHEWKKKIGR
jgi:hypothetical protein